MTVGGVVEGRRSGKRGRVGLQLSEDFCFIELRNDTNGFGHEVIGLADHASPRSSCSLAKLPELTALADTEHLVALGLPAFSVSTWRHGQP